MLSGQLLDSNEQLIKTVTWKQEQGTGGSGLTLFSLPPPHPSLKPSNLTMPWRQADTPAAPHGALGPTSNSAVPWGQVSDELTAP